LRVSPQLYQLERENHYEVSNIHHRKIVRAIREGDEATATQELILDISGAYEVLVRTLFSKIPTR
jgi:DNA-binding GntR family transcriptional regulator